MVVLQNYLAVVQLSPRNGVNGLVIDSWNTSLYYKGRQIRNPPRAANRLAMPLHDSTGAYETAVELINYSAKKL